ncbi:SH3 domain-containing protein C23A1.17-like isoform X1 [Punica granatum]|uniref:SH3 domain-containing protein C23A1.17-like isoform X1 n=1 Tax=Punica granatum TaxID=22663 RepID=A0A6P8DVK6_PUNGR|nr:SH3 domain-containing protein C23A1.17-like isoform X1 [Punica granatum]
MNPIKNPFGPPPPDFRKLVHPNKMAPGSANCLFLLFHLLISCSSGEHDYGDTATSSVAGLQVFPSDGRVRSSAAGLGLSVDLWLSERQVKNLIASETSTVSWLKARLLLDKRIRNIIVRFGHGNSGPCELQNLQLTLETVNRIIGNFGNKHRVELSVAFPLPHLEKLTEGNAMELISGIDKSISKIIIEDRGGKDKKRADRFIGSIVERAHLVSSRLPSNGFHVVLAIRGPAAPKEVSQLRYRISESFKSGRTKPNGRIVEIRNVQEPISVPSRRALLKSDHMKSTGHDTDFPVTPTPIIVTVPATAGPVAISPTNPNLTPLAFPPPIPVTFPTPPVTVPVTPIPVTNPVPVTPVPVTNPVTTYPSTPGIPTVTPTPVPTTNPPATPSTSPAIPGQSWCVAKAGASEAALQAALDYACGIGGADCSQIQMGASCYNPNTLENHASYAFNSYYQKNPVATSCDFSGTATIVAANPSTGACIYPTSQTSAPATTTPTTPTPTPTTAALPPPSTGAVPVPVPVPVPGSGTPPAVLNSGNPPSGNPTDFGNLGPPPPATFFSTSARLQPYVGCIIVLISLVLQDLCCRDRK